MKIVVDCEFTQLNATSKLISMALVAEDAQELYFELTDNYGFPDCSDFVLEHVLPQLDGGHVACTIHEAKVKLQAFLKKFELVQIMSDAPLWDWEFFCEIAYFNNKWPGNVLNRPINLIDLYNEKDIQVDNAPELPHHALLDARLLMRYYKKYLRE
jgi:DNA polymerase III epsilon subunit-like protein